MMRNRIGLGTTHRIIGVLLGLTLMLGVACDLSGLPASLVGKNIDPGMMETAMAFSLQMTVAALEADQAQKDSEQGLVLTQNAQAVQATIAAMPTFTPIAPPAVEDLPTGENPLAAETAPQEGAPPAPQAAEEEPQAAPAEKAGFEEWLPTAKILLYEDMTGTGNVKRTILDALEGLGLKADDAKSNAGVFLSKISAPPDSKGWDLIISGVEARRGAGGADFIEPIRTAMKDHSSAAIMEQWNIDAYRNRATGLLNDCGVEFHQDFNSPGPMSAAGQVLYPLDAVDPILNEPNGDIRISNVTDYWPDYYGIGTTDYEYGDKLKKAPGSAAVFVLGLKANEPDSYGVLVNCMDRRLTLLTVSTHAYSSERIRPLWENMIYQALKARYNSIGE